MVAILPFIGWHAARTGVTTAAGWTARQVASKAPQFATKFKNLFGGNVGKTAGGLAATGAGAGLFVGANLLGIALIAAGVLAVGALGFGIYKMFSGGGDKSAEQVAAENPALAQALSPALQPQMQMGAAPMMPKPVMQPTPVMQSGMIPHAAYATQSYPAAVVDVPQMMHTAPADANSWQARVGGSPVSQGSYVQSLTDPAAIAAMNNQQIQ